MAFPERSAAAAPRRSSLVPHQTLTTRVRLLLLTAAIVAGAISLAALPAWGPGACDAAAAPGGSGAAAVAAQVREIDAAVAQAVAEYARAAAALEAVRRQVAENRRLQRLGELQLAVAREMLVSRAVTLYKTGDVDALDAVFAADDFGELVTDLALVRRVADSDRDVVREIERTRRELADRAVRLRADERTAERLVAECRARVAEVRRRLAEREALLGRLRAEERRQTVRAATAASATYVASASGAAAGRWWPLIRAAAAANGVSARGLYRLMMAESGGVPTIVGPGGYIGLFQYSPATWRGAWNPWRARPITDGAAQIRATALAVAQGRGPSWWGATYAWAFGL